MRTKSAQRLSPLTAKRSSDNLKGSLEGVLAKASTCGCPHDVQIAWHVKVLQQVQPSTCVVVCAALKRACEVRLPSTRPRSTATWRTWARVRRGNQKSNIVPEEISPSCSTKTSSQSAACGAQTTQLEHRDLQNFTG